MTNSSEKAADTGLETVANSESDLQICNKESSQPTVTDQAHESAEAEQKSIEVDDAVDHNQEQTESVEDLLQKYKWYKCRADPATYGEGHHYYTQTETGESSWVEPNEPYWIWNTETGTVDPAGLQKPGQAQPTPSSAQRAASEYQGYNPRIHGNYDPNADYAKYYRGEQGLKSTTHEQPLDPDATATYTSAMMLNRFSGATQTGDQGPERHSDAAKSSRQMNAFFDVDAAANSHDGRSLKAERQAQRLSKQQIKEFNAKRAEKKHKKRMQQLLS